MWNDDREIQRGYNYARGHYKRQGEMMVWGCLIIMAFPVVFVAGSVSVFLFLKWLMP